MGDGRLQSGDGRDVPLAGGRPVRPVGAAGGAERELGQLGSDFVAYSTRLNWYLPDALQQTVAALATAGELMFAVALIAGIYTRLAAYGAASLLTCFALAMATGLGVRSPLDYSVFVDAAGAWLLAAAIPYDSPVATWRHQGTSKRSSQDLLPPA